MARPYRGARLLAVARRAVRVGDRVLRRWARGPYASNVAIVAASTVALSAPVLAACALFDLVLGSQLSGLRSGADTPELAVAAAAAAAIGLGALRLCRFESQFTERQALTAFVVAMLVGVATLAAVHLAVGAVAPTGLAAAVAEAAATVTATNTTVLDPQQLGGGTMLLRALGQWASSAAFILVLVRVLPELGIGGLDSDGGVATRSARQLAARSIGTLGRLLLLYLLLTGLAAAAYWIAGMPVVKAGFHALTTVSGGGFSTERGSIGAFDAAAVEWVAVVFMALGGVSLPLMFLALRRRDPARFLRSHEFGIYASLLLFGAALVAVWTPGPFDSEHLRDAVFAVASALSTTGFTTEPLAAFSPGSGVLLVSLMLVGGMAASVSGGFKIMRMLALSAYVRRELRRAVHPNLAERLRLGHSSISERTMSRIVGELLLAGIVAVPCVLLLASDGLSLEGAVSFAASLLANCGPALGAAGADGHLAQLDSLGRVVVSLLMLIGKASATALAVALSVAAYPLAGMLRHGRLRRRWLRGLRAR